jgi:predicted RNase H-like HicB family nuclease
MNTRYFGLLDGKEGAYGISFPDAPGSTAMGKTIDEAIRNAVEALSEWIAHSDNAGFKRPVPRDPVALRHDSDVQQAIGEGAVLVAVPFIVGAGRPVRANLSIDAGVLEAIDGAAERAGMTRSAFLVDAALEKIKASA